MAAPDPLETIVRAEVGDRVRDLVREIVRAIAREELDRIAAGLNGGPAPAATTSAGGPQPASNATGGVGEAPAPPERETAPPRRCRSCGETKPAAAFEAGRRQCRRCRRDGARRNYRARQARPAAAGDANGDPPG